MSARKTRRCRPGGAGGDDGQTTVLTLGLVVVALLLVTVVVSATGVHLDRKRLLATADATALEAADALSTASYFDPSTGAAAISGGQILLTDRAVEGAARAYLAENPEIRERFVRLELVDAAAVDGRSAQVRLRAVVRPALVSWVTAPWSDGIVLEAESTARAW